MFNVKNSKRQGDIGLAQAIATFSRIGYTVSVPLTDSQAYDLIVDKDGVISRVQVKTTSYKQGKYFRCSLTVKGGNRSSSGKIKKFDKLSVELLYVLTADGKEYIIPTDKLTSENSICLPYMWEEFTVGRFG